ncbi:hypothetical protein D3C86_2031700 [compost metagenome]
MHGTGRLEPIFPHLVGLWFLAFELGDHLPFQHIGHYRPWMLVGQRTLTWRITDSKHDSLLARHIAQVLLLQNGERFLTVRVTMSKNANSAE